ncbi:MAG: hypothetical protein SAK29_39570 [Scytonema sp. PMC 1069.18]|nr:hypothetical protein [Scytonema sp. PMC 1069.18]MEC4887309.1 hypothetical protein [Scytonema sp. PMC 1070.18]
MSDTEMITTALMTAIFLNGNRSKACVSMKDHKLIPIHFNSIVLSLLNFLLNTFIQPRNKIYDYTQQIYGRDYIFKSADDKTKGLMTGYGKGIKSGDYIIFRDGSHFYQYQVEEIDYYSKPSNMWIALLKKIRT